MWALPGGLRRSILKNSSLGPRVVSVGDGTTQNRVSPLDAYGRSLPTADRALGVREASSSSLCHRSISGRTLGTVNRDAVRISGMPHLK